MKVSLLTGTFSASLCATALKTKKLFVNKKANFDLDRDGIDDWTKN
jgi:hypothetical protein